MKFITRITSLSFAIATGFALSGASTMEADPTDDFSFTLAHAPEADVYRLMSERRVTDILVDHLRGWRENQDRIPQVEAAKLARHLLATCRQYRFDPAFVLSLIQVESRFRVRVISHMGAVGLMQVLPTTAIKIAQELGLPLRLDGQKGALPVGVSVESAEVLAGGRLLLDPFVNVTLGVAYLAWLRDHYQGLSPYYLVAAYNVGPGRMDELLSRKNFKPVTTKRYFEAIRREVPGFRFYRRAPRV